METSLDFRNSVPPIAGICRIFQAKFPRCQGAITSQVLVAKFQVLVAKFYQRGYNLTVATYFSTFITGFSLVIKRALEKSLKNIKIELLLDGLVVYQTTSPPTKVVQQRFFNNSFVLIEKTTRPIISNPKSLTHILSFIPKNKKTFRIMISRENRPISIGSERLKELEKVISRATRLKVNRQRPDLEFWFLFRREGVGFFGLRLTQHRDYVKTLHKGEIRPELAHILCLLSEPSEDDIFLDPFAGYGAIPLERVQGFPYKRIYAGDIDRKQVDCLRNKARGLGEKITIYQGDALNLKNFPDGTIDKIVTDPPWGFYAYRNFDFFKFYTQMLQEFCRALRTSGLAVILTARKEILENVLRELVGRVVLEEKYNTLVSGKKAVVCKIRRTNL